MRLEKKLSYLAVPAKQPLPVRKTLTYEIKGVSPYTIMEEGDRLDVVKTMSDVLYMIYLRAHRRVLERFIQSGWIALHAALATIDNKRTLFLGDKGAGKTTLATYLMYARHQVEGDEMVLVRNGQAMPVPRAFHMKPGIENQVPQLAGLVADLPKGHSGDLEFSAFDPSKFGFDWSTEIGPVDRVVLVTGNHGGDTTLVKCTSFQLIQEIIQYSLAWGESRKKLLEAATRLGFNGGYILTLGSPGDAERLLISA